MQMRQLLWRLLFWNDDQAVNDLEVVATFVRHARPPVGANR